LGMKIFYGTSIALGVAGAIVASAVLPAGAADQAPIVKAPVPVVACSNLNWSHGWLDHGGWGGWGYYDGLVVDGWPGSCSTLVGVGPYAMAPRDAAPPPRPKR
jgi:hypothetical protein